MPKPDIDSLTDKIIRYEDGEMDEQETIELFAGLIKNGMAWTLQGHYGRTAQSFIEGGIISPKGQVLDPESN